MKTSKTKTSLARAHAPAQSKAVKSSMTPQSRQSVMVVTLRNAENSLVVLLNQVLANTLDLKLQAKQAHWNVKGPNFSSVHELFDEVAKEVEEYADTLAERVMQLGGQAQGTVQAIAQHSSLPPYPLNITEASQHLTLIANAIGAVSQLNCELADVADEAGDIVTTDICTSISRGLDKLHWFVRSHLQH